MAVAGAELAALLERRGFDFFSGVPCSLIEDLIATLEVHPTLPYVATPREDVAVGLAAGAWLAGRRPAVLMQNSGLGTSLNALTSLSLMYGFPVLLLVTWRGYQGKDAPEHILMGEISPTLLDLLGIPHRVLEAEAVDAELAWAAATMDQAMQPVALLVPPGVVEIGKAHGGDGRTPGPALPAPSATAAASTLKPSVSRLEAVAAARRPLRREPAIHANGYICRESFSLGDRPENFYMIGSMGLASAIGLGLVLAGRRGPAAPASTVVLDGDGNLLMNLGILPLVGALRPRHLVHVVFDNEVYGSTGNQRSISSDIRLDRLAEAAGYRTVTAVTERADITEAVGMALSSDGPHFVLAKVTAEQAEAPRIPYTPHELRDRFRASVAAR
ncbi:MAG TPA: thiamine pyrophosphate-binding protein [Candidatus Methylomirabilis sp.]|nr:thiamine pyrophosphate-binding protein [Candidatus Methylomirabilis sp.]